MSICCIVLSDALELPSFHPPFSFSCSVSAPFPI